MITANVKHDPVHQNATNVLQFALADNGAYLDASTVTSAELHMCNECENNTYTLPDFSVVTAGADNVLQLTITPGYWGRTKLHLKINGFGVNLSMSFINVIKGEC